MTKYGMSCDVVSISPQLS